MKMGCGTIAMSDAELYMTVQNSGYSSSDSSAFGASYQQNGFCSKVGYMNYIENLYDGKYEIKGDIVSSNIGLYPWQMEDGFSKFLSANGSSTPNVRWALYNNGAYLDEKQMVVDDIERMLDGDIPVVFSYHTFNNNDEIYLYNSMQGAINNAGKNEDGTVLSHTPSHYMTIIGLHKYAGDHPLQDKYILQVVSWGQIYYIDYDTYAKKLSYFSNILSVY